MNTALVNNEPKSESYRSNRVWQISDASIEEDDCYKHLGIHYVKYLSLDQNVKSAIAKLKSTLLSLGNWGLHKEGLNPIPSKHIYKTIVFQKPYISVRSWITYLLNT